MVKYGNKEESNYVILKIFILIIILHDANAIL
jgi:hypothetical protein